MCFLLLLNHIAALKTRQTQRRKVFCPKTHRLALKKKKGKKKSQDPDNAGEFLNWILERKKDINGTTDEIRFINNNSVSAVLIIVLWLCKMLTFDYSG